MQNPFQFCIPALKTPQPVMPYSTVCRVLKLLHAKIELCPSTNAVQLFIIFIFLLSCQIGKMYLNCDTYYHVFKRHYPQILIKSLLNHSLVLLLNLYLPIIFSFRVPKQDHIVTFCSKNTLNIAWIFRLNFLMYGLASRIRDMEAELRLRIITDVISW